MDYKANIGIWGTMFGVPCIVADNFLKLATGGQIKVLLYLLRCSGKSCTDEEIAANTGVSPQEAAEAVIFWQQANVLTPQNIPQSAPVMTGFAFQTIPQPVVQSAETHQNIAPLKNIQPVKSAEPEKKKAVPNRKVNLQPSEISKIMQDSADISELFQISESILGTLNHTQQNSLIWMYTHLGLKKEVIIILLSYCAQIEKTHSNYIEKIACDWSDNDINTLESAQERVDNLVNSSQFYSKIKASFNMTRGMTSNEKEIADSWKNAGYSMDLINYACELTVEKIDKINFKYTNTILESWKNDGFSTVSEVKNSRADYKKNKKTKPSADDPDIDKYKICVNNF